MWTSGTGLVFLFPAKSVTNLFDLSQICPTWTPGRTQAEAPRSTLELTSLNPVQLSTPHFQYSINEEISFGFEMIPKNNSEV